MRRRRRFVTAGRRRRFVTAGRRRRFGSTVFFSDYLLLTRGGSDEGKPLTFSHFNLLRYSDAVVPTKVNPLTLFHFNLLRYSDAVVPTKLITCLDIPLSVTWNVANTPLLSIAKPDKFIVIKSRYIQFWIQHYIPHVKDNMPMEHFTLFLLFCYG
ncbi:hypothetical protein Lal_00031352 [Lupinus albus]|nr:hypothetical protein Lal_00031352 [Lupinus albus]